MAWALILLYILLTLPVRAGVVFHWRDQRPFLYAGILILGFALGVTLCLSVSRAIVRLDGEIIKQTVFDLLRVYLLNILPLLAVAAVIEAYVTPLLLGSALGKWLFLMSQKDVNKPMKWGIFEHLPFFHEQAEKCLKVVALQALHNG